MRIYLSKKRNDIELEELQKHVTELISKRTGLQEELEQIDNILTEIGKLMCIGCGNRIENNQICPCRSK